MLIIFQMTLTALLTGPFHHSAPLPPASSSKTKRSSWTWIDLIVGLLDTMFYLVSLNSSVPMTNDPQSFREINQTFEILRSSKTMFAALLDECLQMNSTERSSSLLSTNLREKSSTLKFAEPSDSTDGQSRLFHRVQFFILTYSFLLYVHQLVLWFLRYLSAQNSAWNSSMLVAAIVLLVQTFGLISFLQITEFYHCCSPLSLYLSLMWIRSFASIYAQIFRIDE